MNRREFVLTMVGGAVAAVTIPFSSNESDEIVISLNHSKLAEADIHRRGADGAWHPIARVPNGVSQFVDRVYPGSKHQYRVRSIIGARKSKWTYTEWSV